MRGNHDSDARLNEIARILALGIRRLRAKPSETGAYDADPESEFGLDFSPRQSVHADRYRETENTHD